MAMKAVFALVNQYIQLMVNIVLTYETIRKISAEEGKSPKLVKLPGNFFSEIKEYLDKKASITKDKGDAWEFENARMELQHILEMRERKVMMLAMYFVRSGVVPENMTFEEKEFFNKVVENVKAFQANKKRMFEGRMEKRALVAMLDSLPSFVGVNMKNYGPFKKGDMVTLPEENARLLVEKGLARKVEADL